MQCLADQKQQEALGITYNAEHQGGTRLFAHLLHLVYYWSTMEADCCEFVRRCHECQIHSNLIHAPSSHLHNLSSPWPFSVWGIDIIGKINPKASNGHEFILVAIDYFTKWVEAASYSTITATHVCKFIKNNLVCRYGVPNEIITDNGTNLTARKVDDLCKQFKIEEGSDDHKLKYPIVTAHLDRSLRNQLTHQILTSHFSPSSQ